MARDLSDGSALVECCMDVSTIKPPVEPTEAEPHASTPQASDHAFLQLLASLGFTLPLPVDAGPSATANDGTVAQADSLEIEPGGLVCAATLNAAQEQMMTAGEPNVEAAQNGTQPQEVAAHGITLAGKDQSDLAGTVVEALATREKDVSAKDQPMTAQGKPALPVTALADAKGAPESRSQATTTKDEPHAAPTRLMDLTFSSAAQAQLGQASAATPESRGPTPHVAIQPSDSPDTAAKQTTVTASSLVSSVVMESSDLQQGGTDHHSASAEHDGGKERFTSAETNGTQPTSSPVASSFSSQAPPAPNRTTAPAVVAAPTVTVPLESPLPASVRFEVQPGDMGRIRVHLSVFDHTVYTNVMTERVEAHDFLVRGSERFEAGLAAHGLDVGRFQVDVQGQARQHADRGGTAWSQDDLHRRNSQSSEQPMVERHAGDREPDRMHRMINVFA
jgi:hypothetical protein